MKELVHKVSVFSRFIFEIKSIGFLATAYLSFHHSDPRQPPATWLLFIGPGVDL